MNSNTLSKIKSFLNLKERTDNCYFWTVGENARGRRRLERELSFPEFKFKYKKDEYTIEITMSVSCHNFYRNVNIYKNGERKNVTVIKKIVAVETEKANKKVGD